MYMCLFSKLLSRQPGPAAKRASAFFGQAAAVVKDEAPLLAAAGTSGGTAGNLWKLDFELMKWVDRQLLTETVV